MGLYPTWQRFQRRKRARRPRKCEKAARTAGWWVSAMEGPPHPQRGVRRKVGEATGEGARAAGRGVADAIRCNRSELKTTHMHTPAR